MSLKFIIVLLIIHGSYLHARLEESAQKILAAKPYLKPQQPVETSYVPSGIDYQYLQKAVDITAICYAAWKLYGIYHDTTDLDSSYLGALLRSWSPSILTSIPNHMVFFTKSFEELVRIYITKSILKLLIASYHHNPLWDFLHACRSIVVLL